jgi:hypothetical protein
MRQIAASGFHQRTKPLRARCKGKVLPCLTALKLNLRKANKSGPSKRLTIS